MKTMHQGEFMETTTLNEEKKVDKKNKYFEKRAKTYDIYLNVPVISKVRKDEKKILNNLVDQHLKSKDSVLEIGCGTGYYTLYAANKCKEVMGIDLSEKMINIASKKIENKNINNVTLKTMDIRNANFSRKYDKTLCIGVLDYVKDPSEVLAKCSQFTAKTMIITAPNKSIIGRVSNTLSKITKTEHRYYTKQQLKKSLIDAGFSDVDIYETGIKTKITNGATLIAVAKK